MASLASKMAEPPAGSPAANRETAAAGRSPVIPRASLAQTIREWSEIWTPPPPFRRSRNEKDTDTDTDKHFLRRIAPTRKPVFVLSESLRRSSRAGDEKNAPARRHAKSPGSRPTASEGRPTPVTAEHCIDFVFAIASPRPSGGIGGGRGRKYCVIEGAGVRGSCQREITEQIRAQRRNGTAGVAVPSTWSYTLYDWPRGPRGTGLVIQSRSHRQQRFRVIGCLLAARYRNSQCEQPLGESEQVLDEAGLPIAWRRIQCHQMRRWKGVPSHRFVGKGAGIDQIASSPPPRSDGVVHHSGAAHHSGLIDGLPRHSVSRLCSVRVGEVLKWRDPSRIVRIALGCLHPPPLLLQNAFFGRIEHCPGQGHAPPPPPQEPSTLLHQRARSEVRRETEMRALDPIHSPSNTKLDIATGVKKLQAFTALTFTVVKSVRKIKYGGWNNLRRIITACARASNCYKTSPHTISPVAKSLKQGITLEAFVTAARSLQPTHSLIVDLTVELSEELNVVLVVELFVLLFQDVVLSVVLFVVLITAKRVHSTARGSQSDTRPVPKASRSQSVNEQAHFKGTATQYRLCVLTDSTPPTKANRVQSPPGSPDLRMWKSCRTMSLVGGFSRGSPVTLAPSFRRCSIFTSITLIGSQDLAVKRCPNLFTHSLSLNSTVLYTLELASFLRWLLYSCEATPFMSELRVIGAHGCRVFINWRRVTQGVSNKVRSNDKHVAELAGPIGLSFLSVFTLGWQGARVIEVNGREKKGRGVLEERGGRRVDEPELFASLIVTSFTKLTRIDAQLSFYYPGGERAHYDRATCLRAEVAGEMGQEGSRALTCELQPVA
ncbi:hypothetical protein PR048_004489 [Dryococelus australis]|uniref:Uncharacterized protein n=1 Tax=Dryococelus australis TaxID=614101 RepID=A0ABQ9I5K4_9NEOP|nr:hypothetical protein PR048_004489 [Dryococelus australis]